MFGFFNNRSRQGDDRLAPGFRSFSERAYIVKEVLPGGFGRLRHQGIEWIACADDGERLPVGTEVILLSRRGTTWLVAPVYQPTLLTVA